MKICSKSHETPKSQFNGKKKSSSKKREAGSGKKKKSEKRGPGNRSSSTREEPEVERTPSKRGPGRKGTNLIIFFFQNCHFVSIYLLFFFCIVWDGKRQVI